MAARPPKLSLWNEQLVTEAPGVFAAKPTVPTSWQYFCGAVGYWLPAALNTTHSLSAAIRNLR